MANGGDDGISFGDIAEFGIPAALSLGSGLVAGFGVDSPDTPPLSDLAGQEIAQARQEQREAAEERQDRLEENIAATNAAGAIAAGQREDLFDAEASAAAELEGRAAELIQDAIRQERLLGFREDQRRAQNRASAITGIGQSLAGLTADFLSDEDIDLFGGGEGDGGGGVGGPFIDPVGAGGNSIFA